jgi:hypothetical protein
MRMFSSLRVTLLILASALFWTAVLCVLPNNAYQRWQTLKGTEYDTLRTIYERIHYDPRPLDVVILGPSKAALDLSIKRIRGDLAASGVTANASNFAVMASGRDKDYAVAKELYQTKSPKVLVIGVDAVAFPYGHPVFKYFADASEIAFPPAFGLHEHPYNLAYLPFRQLRMFVANLFPDALGLTKTFDPRSYAQRETLDDTEGFMFHGKWIDTTRRETAEGLAATPLELRKPSLMTRILYRFNDGDDHTYIRKIVERARAHGTKVIFVYLPEYGAPTQTSEASFLVPQGTLVSAGDLSGRPDLYMEVHHLNRYGAQIASDRVAAAIAAALGKPSQTAASAPNQRGR